MMSSRAVGRWTLITTRSPPVRVARWTSAMVPAAIGVGSMLAEVAGIEAAVQQERPQSSFRIREVTFVE